VDEKEVMGNFSRTLRREVLGYFCRAALDASVLFKDKSDGFRLLLVAKMEPYLALPGERIVSPHSAERDNVCLYVLSEGKAHLTDQSGETENIAPGSVISSDENAAQYAAYGKPKYTLVVQVLSASGLKASGADMIGVCSPSVELACGARRVRSTTRKLTRRPYWHEKFHFKVMGDNADAVTARVFNFQAAAEPALIGSCEVSLRGLMAGVDKELKDKRDGASPSPKKGDKRGRGRVPGGRAVLVAGNAVMPGVPRGFDLLDAQGRAAGRLTLAVRLRPVRPDLGPKITATTSTFCHLYLLKDDALAAVEALAEREGVASVDRWPSGRGLPARTAKAHVEQHNAAAATGAGEGGGGGGRPKGMRESILDQYQRTIWTDAKRVVRTQRRRSGGGSFGQRVRRWSRAWGVGS